MLNLDYLDKKSFRFMVLFVAFCSSILFLSRLYEPSLSGDAVKYALISKLMIKTNNYLIPQLPDGVYLKKPRSSFGLWLSLLNC